MPKMRTLIGLAVMLGAFLVTAVPAMAIWQSLPTKSQITSGKATPLNAGVFIGKNAKGEIQAEVKCPVEGIAIGWQIRSTGKSSEDITGPGQRETKRGPHLQLHIRWQKAENGCITEAGGLKLAANVPECILQLHQNPGQLVAQAEVVTACEIKVPAIKCTLTVPVTNQASKINYQLTKIELENKLENQNDKANVNGITTTNSGGACPPVTTSELNKVEFEVLGASAV